MNWGKLLTIFFAGFLLIGTLPATTFSEGPLSLKELIDEAVKANPEIRTLKNRVASLRAAAPQVGTLPDPLLTIGVDNVPVSDPSFDAFLPTSKVIGLSQKVPFPGKLALKEKAANLRADSMESIYRDKVTEIIKRVKDAYFDLHFINQSIRINERNRELLSGLADVAATKYSVGNGLQQDVLKAQVELSKILDNLIVLRQKKETARARINTLLNRPPEAPLADPGERGTTPFSFTLEELNAKALKTSLPLKAMTRLIEGSEADLHLAEKEFFPDFNFAVTYKQREEGANFPGDDWFSAFITVNIPLYAKRKQRQGVIESQAELARRESTYNEVKNRVLFEVKDTFEEIEKEGELIQLYEKGFLPQARQSLDSAISGYQVDKVDFLTLVDNQLTLLRFELAYARTLADYEKQLARMEAIVDERLF